MGVCSSQRRPSKFGAVVSSKFPGITLNDLGEIRWSPDTVSRRIDAQIAKDKQKMVNTMKLLLLGPAEAGKTTLLKQIK
ncbi:hypothetical protein AAVH_11513 [Aphelenchoides avenae]|nr:hypothetical protein AAVH_37805 [Aphelenchus avenae]KAH7721046.1 hypothetical protein AAVH_11513 [Aphelenchus avenae]